jgi:hypothetical protein
MTNLVGFAEKRNNFRNECLKDDAERHRIKNGRKKCKTSVFQIKPSRISCHCEAAARPWQSLSQRHGIPWRSTGVRSKKEYLSQKTGDLLHRFASSLFIPRFCFVPRNHSSFRDDKSFRQRLPRRAQKLRPPRKDRIVRLDRKHGTQNPIFGIRKTFLICCLILAVPDFFDSLKTTRPLEPRGHVVCRLFIR